MIISQYFVFFIIFSFLGWVWETIYCTARERHFSSRGFLFGPVCPIYGCSVVVGMMIFRQIYAASGSMPLWEVFIICAVGSAFAEYVTSYCLEKRFHARWWDYSSMPLNLHGRICLPVTICFGIAGTLLVHFVIPVLGTMQVTVEPLVYEAAALVLMGAFGADFALTQASLSTLLERIEALDREFTERGETVYEAISSTPQQMEIRKNNFEIEMHERACALAGELSARQRSVVNRISRFRPALPERHEFKAGDRLKEALRELKNR